MTGTAWNVEKMSFFGEKKISAEILFSQKTQQIFQLFLWIRTIGRSCFWLMMTLEWRYDVIVRNIIKSWRFFRFNLGSV